MEEKELKELKALLEEVEKDLDEGKVEEAKAKVAAAKEKVKLPGTGSNGFPENHK